MTQYRKFVAALVGALLVAVSQGLIVGTAAKVVAVVVAFLTAVGVHSVRNEDTGASTVEVCLIVLTGVALLWAFGVVPR